MNGGFFEEGQHYVFKVPMRISYGIDSTLKILESLSEMSLQPKKCLLVVDSGVLKNGIADPLIKLLKNDNIELNVFEVGKEPDDVIVAQGAEIQKKFNPDILIALGGGSSIDAAKGINVLAHNEGTIQLYEGMGTVVNSLKPLVAIPTTAGTGSEMGNAAVIVDSTRKIKICVYDDKLYPVLAILDPMLTINLPPLVTAGSGLDALGHAMPAVMTTATQPMTKPFALYSVQLIAQSIEEATFNGSNIDARSRMMLGSGLAGLAMYTADLTFEHALGEAVGGYYGVPHGISVGTFLPQTFRMNAEARPLEAKELYFALTGKLVSNEKDLPNLMAEELYNLNKKLNIPHLSEYGCKVSDIPQLIENTLIHCNYATGPKVPTRDELKAIYEEAFSS